MNTTSYTFMDGKARTSTMTIPKKLQKDGRTFMMICVSENGIAYTYPDTDQDPATITFTYDRLYAYALALIGIFIRHTLAESVWEQHV